MLKSNCEQNKDKFHKKVESCKNATNFIDITRDELIQSTASPQRVTSNE